MISSIRKSAISVVLLILGGCAVFGPRPTEEEKALLAGIRKNLSYEYTQPRLVQGELVLTISDIRPVSADSLARLREKYGIPAEAPPRMEIWSAGMKNYGTQFLVSEEKIDPAPEMSYLEHEYTNRIHYWWLPDSLDPQDSVRISRTFTYITFDYRPDVNVGREGDYWEYLNEDIRKKYTVSERFLEQDQALQDTVAKVTAGVENPVLQARAIYDWIQKTMTYVYPPQERGVRHAFASREGDCGQYSALFITMARIAGIPARQQSGFNFYPGNTGAHVWSEIFLPWKGWVPVDVTREDGFFHLDNGRLIASTGLNIPLEPVPEWASLEFSEVADDRTDFMQMYTLLNFGYSATFRVERHVHRSVKF